MDADVDADADADARRLKNESTLLCDTSRHCSLHKQYNKCASQALSLHALRTTPIHFALTVNLQYIGLLLLWENAEEHYADLGEMGLG